MKHLIQIEIDDTDKAYTAHLIYNGEQAMIQELKDEPNGHGRFTHKLDHLFTGIRQAVGAKLFPHDTLKFIQTGMDDTGVLRYRVDGHMDDLQEHHLTERFPG